jgi:hypothetical protein
MPLQISGHCTPRHYRYLAIVYNATTNIWPPCIMPLQTSGHSVPRHYRYLATVHNATTNIWPLYTTPLQISGHCTQCNYRYLATVRNATTDIWPLYTMLLQISDHCTPRHYEYLANVHNATTDIWQLCAMPQSWCVSLYIVLLWSVLSFKRFWFLLDSCIQSKSCPDISNFDYFSNSTTVICEGFYPHFLFLLHTRCYIVRNISMLHFWYSIQLK